MCFFDALIQEIIQAAMLCLLQNISIILDVQEANHTSVMELLNPMRGFSRRMHSDKTGKMYL
jgi:hypothetical protein